MAWTNRMQGFLPPSCPFCQATPVRPFLYGQVTRFGDLDPRSFLVLWRLIRRIPIPTVSVICWGCKNVVGWEERNTDGKIVVFEYTKDAHWRMIADAY